MNGIENLNPLGLKLICQFSDRVLSLSHRKAIARDDGYALHVREEHTDVLGGALLHRALLGGTSRQGLR
jgi:hypothetical protein